MKKIVILLLFFTACTQNKQSNDSGYFSNNDSLCFTDNSIHQCCISFSQRLNDSLQIQFAKGGLEYENYLSIGGGEQVLKIMRRSDSISASIFFQSGKDAMQKLILDKTEKDTLYLRMRLARDGKDDQFWIHQIEFSYYEPTGEINNVVLLD